MNKAMKGAIAAGAAGILLLGGAGTFAVWSDSRNVTADAVNTGVLSLDVNPDGDAKWAETADLATEISPATFEIVPGDSLTYTATVAVTATGDNLTGELKIDEASFNTAFDALSGEHVTATVAHAAADGAGVHVDDLNENRITFDESATPYTFDVTIRIDFNAAAAELEDQDLDLNLPALALTLDQVL